MNDSTRRSFLKTAVASLAAGHAVPALARHSSMPIVDTHQHLWDLSKFDLAWLKPGGPLTRNYLTEDYLAATEGLGVAKTVYMEVNVAPEQRLAEAEYVVEICRRDDNPTVAAVIAGDPGGETFAQYITRFRESPYIKGVRYGLRKPEQIADARLIEGIRLLGRLGMRFDLLVPTGLLAEGAGLVSTCPDTPFVLDHCGNADPVAFLPKNIASPRAAQHDADRWRRDIDALAERPNVVCKISGVIARVIEDVPLVDQLAPIVNHCLDSFGPERVLFAGDWPVCTRGAPLADWIGTLKEIVRDRSESEQRKLLHDNAMRFYGLS